MHIIGKLITRHERTAIFVAKLQLSMDERMQEISDHFTKSWKATQAQYEDLINHPEFNHLIPLYLFIQKLTKARENNIFHLAISMQDLIFSRSIEADLGPNQKYLTIKALDNSFVITLKEGKKMLREYTIKDLDDERLTVLLQLLKDISIS